MATTAEGPGLAAVHVLLRGHKQTYRPGEPVPLTLQVVNRGGNPVTLQFLTAQRYDAVIRDRQGGERWRWSAGQMFAQVLGEVLLSPGARLTYRITVRASLPSGEYTVEGIVPVETGPLSATTTITVK